MPVPSEVDPMRILKVVDSRRWFAALYVPSEVDPMRILKACFLAPALPSPIGSKRSRSDEDTESPTAKSGAGGLSGSKRSRSDEDTESDQGAAIQPPAAGSKRSRSDEDTESDDPGRRRRCGGVFQAKSIR